jgi:BMFP domain-containing protein YqiC
VPIHDCIRRGDQQEMRQMAARARKHISEVKAALAALEKKMAAG